MHPLLTLQGSHPIYIATLELQRRKHRKKRTNKKWRKRYGCYELNLMPHNEVVMMDNGVIWMTKKTFECFMKSLPKKLLNFSRIPYK